MNSTFNLINFYKAFKQHEYTVTILPINMETKRRFKLIIDKTLSEIKTGIKSRLHYIDINTNHCTYGDPH